MTSSRSMEQTAPFPEALEDIVLALAYKPGWQFALTDMERDPPESHGWSAGGLTFVVTTLTHNAYDPHLRFEVGPRYRVNHYFIVPAATYNRQSWLRWVFDCLVKVETHECMEFFALVNPEAADPENPRLHRPYAPTHGPGDDPYVVHEYATDVQARTKFTGAISDK